jgi:hypothetical protein
MNTLHSPRRRTRLASACALALLAAGAIVPFDAAQAATRTVTTCVDGGFGSLRDALRIAASGDTIDMTGLACSRITLTRGQLPIPQSDLTLVGPGRFALTIDGANAAQMFWHSGTGTLRIDRLSIANGFHASNDVRGACVHSEGRVELIRSRVFRCTGHARNALEPFASGGGVYARQEVLLSRSAVFGNFVTHSGGGVLSSRVTLYRSQVYDNDATDGGGIAAGEVIATYSLIHGNRASSNGAGISATTATLNKSTVSSNVSRFGNGGGLHASNAGRWLIIDSTISGNSATGASAAYLSAAPTTIINSTIVMNHDVRTSLDQPCMGAVYAGPTIPLRLENSIVALSTCNSGTAYDIGGNPPSFIYPVVGASNLIGSSKMPVPADTITANPRLAPLAENGGPTRTHMLLADSPAINRGHNNFNREFDQRGPGFPRVKGAFPDIGAIER